MHGCYISHIATFRNTNVLMAHIKVATIDARPVRQPIAALVAIACSLGFGVVGILSAFGVC